MTIVINDTASEQKEKNQSLTACAAQRWASFYTTVKWMGLTAYVVSSAIFCSDVHGYIATSTPRTPPTAHLQTYRAFCSQWWSQGHYILKKILMPQN